MRLRRYLGPLAAGVLLLGAGVVITRGLSSASSSRDAHTRARSAPSTPGRWIAAWSASPQATASGFDNQTVREIVFTAAGGSNARVRFTNRFGDQPLEIRRAALAPVRAGAAVADGTNAPLRFAGSRSIVIPAGGDAVSDPVHLDVRPLEHLAVSVFLPRLTRRSTGHPRAGQATYVAAGDHALDPSDGAFSTQVQSSYFVSGVDVWNSSRNLGTVVAFGDSITDGVGTDVDTDASWPDDLARRLTMRDGDRLSVVDAGVSGNRVLRGSPCCGVSALERFRHDALGQPGVTEVILLEGINDIGHSRLVGRRGSRHRTVTAAQIISAYQRLIAWAHAAGVKIFGATLTPFQGSFYWTPARRATRDAVNAWIRHSGAFDGVIDFASAVAAPRDRGMLNPAYDSGDHLHPNAAGYRAMADAVPLALLLRAARRPDRAR